MKNIPFDKTIQLKLQINMCSIYKTSIYRALLNRHDSNQDRLLKNTRAQLYSKSKQYVLQIPWQVARPAIKKSHFICA